MITLANININFSGMWEYLPWFWEGTLMTLFLSLVTVIFGTGIGFLFSLLKRSQFVIFKIKIGQVIANLYTQIIRGTPLLLQVYIILYGLPAIGVKIPSIPGWDDSRVFIGCALALAINSGAYVCEIFRSGLNAVDKGQSEAARSLGLNSKQTMRFVVFPQAMRVVLPALGNEFITMIKESSIVSVVGLFDIMYTMNIIKGATLKVFEPLIISAVIYLLVTTVLTTILGQIERKMNKDA